MFNEQEENQFDQIIESPGFDLVLRYMIGFVNDANAEALGVIEADPEKARLSYLKGAGLQEVINHLIAHKEGLKARAEIEQLDKES